MSTARQSLPRPASRGFTLVELLVVMGILSGFLVMLVQLVDSGLSMFREGELGQALADRAARAQRVIGDELQLLRGSAAGRDRDVVDDRLVVQRLPLGLPLRADKNAARGPVLRAAVQLAPDRELALVDVALTARVLAATPRLDDAALGKRVAELRAFEPLRGLGNLVLLPWRQEGSDESLLELRAGWFLPGQLIPIGEDRFVDPFSVPVPGSAELPGLALHAVTLPVLRDLLHFELLLWSQRTRTWQPTADGAGEGPWSVWDSARGGWLVDEASGGVFPLDRGPASAADPRDDVQPHAILVRCVVAQPGESAPEGLLDESVDAEQTSLLLYDGERFPGRAEGGWVKLRNEWIAYAQRDGNRLVGLRRGQRGTAAQDHPSGLRVHVGRTVEFVVPVVHAKDDWNG